ncbi:uncharacterized protein LOC107626389 [Arachis ipaensis]|uniref:uncharacterized protein LOC107626389 n=1 Tax=Arachis ipaensis TaxID=130454 RepID=UPI0007AF6EC3|nr:uncharacterized protein LOC107626389 [Arachis ipaensis]
MEGMVAEKNQRYLMVLMRTKICGIDLMKLITPEKEAVDCENLPPLPFDFSMDLPLGRTFALELDSKIHLVGGLKYMSSYDYYFDHAFYTPCNKVYELDLDKKELEESKSIDDAPELSVSGFTTLHKIGSDYYFMMMCGLGGFIPDNGDQNFWVLRSGTKVWEHLPDAPDLPDLPDLPGYHSIIVHSSWFDFYGKLYIRLCLEDGRVVVFSYDTHNLHWTTSVGDNSFTRSFCVPLASDGQRRFFLPRVHIPDLVDPGKYLALSCECIEGKKVIYAFQVDELGVLFFQRLEGCLDRMPSLYDEKTPVLVDLDGKGTFIVMLHGYAKEEKEDPVLFVLVLQVVAKKFVNHPSRVLRRSVRSPTECEFLDWKVLSMHMYRMEVPSWGIRDDLFAVFIFPDIQWEEENAQEGKKK